MHTSATTITPETRTLIYTISEGIQAKFGKFYFDGDGQIKLHVLQPRHLKTSAWLKVLYLTKSVCLLSRDNVC